MPKPPPMVTYLREPGGLVHLRASLHIRTLCKAIPTEEWEVVTSDRDPLCPACWQRITGFVYNIMRDGDKHPKEEEPPEGHEPCHNP
jgi:hypothetical protein